MDSPSIVLWEAAIKECEKSFHLKGNRNLLRTLKLDRAWCLIETKEYVAANESLEALLSDPDLPSMARQRASALKAETLVCQEEWAAARDFAIGPLLESRHPLARAFLASAVWEAATRLGDPSKAPVPTRRQLELLAVNGRKPWADRLIALGLEPAEERLTSDQPRSHEATALGYASKPSLPPQICVFRCALSCFEEGSSTFCRVRRCPWSIRTKHWQGDSVRSEPEVVAK